MKNYLIAALWSLCILNSEAQTDSTTRHRPWLAVGEAAGINAGVWAMNRYVAHAPFAYIDFKTIRKNFRTGFVWDNDKFSTNMFLHPYHGGLYFNAFRTNGMSFGWSAAGALGGSLMWELFMETEPPSINDVLATTAGGIALGEITFRISSSLVNNHARGLERVWREAAITLVSPVNGFNRLLRGDMWRVNTLRDAWSNEESHQTCATLSTGTAWLSPNGKLFKGTINGFLKLKLEHGDLFSKPYSAPYDYFEVQADLTIRQQATMGDVSLLGRLWSREHESTPGKKLIWGLFQHFDYIVKDTTSNNRRQVPVQISGAAVAGAGLIWINAPQSDPVKLKTSLFVNAVLLGGTHSDYFSVLERDYNLGNGYSIKSFNAITLGKYCRIKLNYHLMHLFTWRNKIDSLYYRTLDPHYLDVQGTQSNTLVHVIKGGCDVALSDRLSASLDLYYYRRESRYDDFPMVTTNTLRMTLGINWWLSNPRKLSPASML